MRLSSESEYKMPSKEDTAGHLTGAVTGVPVGHMYTVELDTREKLGIVLDTHNTAHTIVLSVEEDTQAQKQRVKANDFLLFVGMPGGAKKSVKDMNIPAIQKLIKLMLGNAEFTFYRGEPSTEGQTVSDPPMDEAGTYVLTTEPKRSSRLERAKKKVEAAQRSNHSSGEGSRQESRPNSKVSASSADDSNDCDGDGIETIHDLADVDTCVSLVVPESEMQPDIM